MDGAYVGSVARTMDGNPVKICVTGGTGFIGRHLVLILLEQGHTVIVPTRNESDADLLSNRLHYINCNLLDPGEDLTRCVHGCDVIFNCAGEIHKKEHMMDLHVRAAHRLLQTFINYLNGTGRVGRWIQLSSVGAYGPAIPANISRVVTEATPVAPVGEYETTKTKADQLIMNAAQSYPDLLTYTILRPSNVCGRHMPNNALRDWAQMIRKKIFFFIGSKDAVSTYVHVSDVVKALVACARDRRAANQIFNLSNDCMQTDLVRAMADATHSPYPRYRIPEWLARALSKAFRGIACFPLKESRIDSLVARTRYPGDKLVSVLGFRPLMDISTTIKETISN